MARILDFLRAGVAAAALVIAPQGVVSMLGQQPVPPAVQLSGETQGDNVGESAFIQWALKEGGAFGVILVILFFYRRDWKAATEYWQQQNAITTKLVQESTMANSDMAAAMRENTVVVHQAKNVMARYLPNQPMG